MRGRAAIPRVIWIVAAIVAWTALGLGALMLFWLNVRSVPCAGTILWRDQSEAAACYALADEANVRMFIEQLVLVAAIGIGYWAILAISIRRRRAA